MESTRITSRQNDRIKFVVSLRQSRRRREHGVFLIDGVREISRAVASDTEFQSAFICKGLLSSLEALATVEQLRAGGIEVVEVTPGVFEKLAFGERDEGIVVVAKTPQRSLQELALPDNPLVVVIEGIEKPGNVGAILRTTDGAGVDAVLIVDGKTDLFNPNTIRSSMGTVFDSKVCETTTSESQAWLANQGIQLLALRPDAEETLFDANLNGPIALVLGSEADGLSDDWLGPTCKSVKLPMKGIADSLNVSATAAVVCYEALRQRSATT